MHHHRATLWLRSKTRCLLYQRKPKLPLPEKRPEQLQEKPAKPRSVIHTKPKLLLLKWVMPQRNALYNLFQCGYIQLPLPLAHGEVAGPSLITVDYSRAVAAVSAKWSLPWGCATIQPWQNIYWSCRVTNKSKERKWGEKRVLGGTR